MPGTASRAPPSAALFACRSLFRRRAPLAALLAGLAVIILDNTVLPGLAEAGAFLVGVIIAHLLGRPLGTRARRMALRPRS